MKNEQVNNLAINPEEINRAVLISRRKLINNGMRFLAGTAGILALPMIVGCGGGGGSESAGADDGYGASFDAPDTTLYVSRITTDQTAHYSYSTGEYLDYCPTCQIVTPPAIGGALSYAIRFEGDDQAAFDGSEASDFTGLGGPLSSPQPPGDSTGGTGTTPPGQPSPQSYLPKDDGQFGANFFNFFYVRGGRLETHPLTPCVNVDVLHTHLTVKRRESTPDSEAWMKLHIGVYRDGGNRCYVLYDNLHKQICFKVCVPDSGPVAALESLESLLHDALTAGFTAAGIRVASWVIAGASVVLATALLPAILVL